MERRLSLLLCQGVACLLTIRGTAATAAAAVEACDSRGASTAGSVLLQKASGVQRRSVPEEAESVPLALEHRTEAVKASTAAQHGASLAAVATGKAKVEAAKAVAEKVKAAPKAAKSATESVKAAPEAVKAAPEVAKVLKAATDSRQHHHVIPAAPIGPAGGQAMMSHDADPGIIDEVAVGSLDFLATGGNKEYCKSWLHNHGFLCDFGAIFLGLLVCTPILALSVAAFWGIVSGLKSVHQ